MTTPFPVLSHWKFKSDENQILWLACDKKDASANVLSDAVMRELEQCLDYLETANPRGLVIHSAKPSGFIAGADVSEFTLLKDQDQALAYIRYCQTLFNRLQNLSCPTLALIDGFCLGGGLELVLACRYRIACDEPKTRLGLPEVRLGIHPGFGGTVRLPPLIGPLAAMDLMLSGRTVSARAAQKIGLVDYAVPRRHLITAAKRLLADQPRPFNPKWTKKLLNWSVFRPLISRWLTAKLAKKVRRAHYPAPFAIIDLWQGYSDDPERMMLEEARSEANLLMTDQAQNLIRVFFLQERLKNQGKLSAFKAQHVHVIGAGVMGGDIAAWCAAKGLRVTLQDQTPERIAPAIKRAHQLFKKLLKEPRLIQQAMDQLIPDVKGLGVGVADVVIEAIFENREAKQTLYRTIEPQMKPTALLATNTSSIPLEELATVLNKPERLIGLHFFNPVAKMQLVEIVSTEHSDPEAVQAVAAFARRIDRLPLPVRSTPGFLVNRILMPYLLEAVEMLAEGIAPEHIDSVATEFGMPMGPVELADTVGLDVCLSVAEILSSHLGGTVPALLREKVAAKELGRKTGKGFYLYQNDRPVLTRPSNTEKPPSAIRERLVSRLLNEAMVCLREQVVKDEDLLDAGIIFGTGFAPFRGGPMHYARKIGFAHQKAQFEELKLAYGNRFQPDHGWDSFKNAT